METNLLTTALLVAVATLSLRAQEATPSKDAAAEKAPACATCDQSVAAQSATPQEVHLKSITFPKTLKDGVAVTFNNFRHEPKVTIDGTTNEKEASREFSVACVYHEGSRSLDTRYTAKKSLRDPDTGAKCAFPVVVKGTNHQEPHAHGHPRYTTLLFDKETPSKCTIMKSRDKQGKAITTINCKQTIIDVATQDGSDLSYTLETQEEGAPQNK